MSYRNRYPFQLFNELQRDMNRLFDNRLQPANGTTTLSSSDWAPAVDIHEDAEAYHLAVDLPGVEPDKIEVVAHNGVLSIRGTREMQRDDKTLKRSERLFGSFLREFSMPEDANLDGIRAANRHGVLEIQVPKRAASQPKRIEITH